MRSVIIVVILYQFVVFKTAVNLFQMYEEVLQEQGQKIISPIKVAANLTLYQELLNIF